MHQQVHSCGGNSHNRTVAVVVVIATTVVVGVEAMVTVAVAVTRIVKSGKSKMSCAAVDMNTINTNRSGNISSWDRSAMRSNHTKIYERDCT